MHVLKQAVPAPFGEQELAGDETSFSESLNKFARPLPMRTEQQAECRAYRNCVHNAFNEPECLQFRLLR